MAPNPAVSMCPPMLMVAISEMPKLMLPLAAQPPLWSKSVRRSSLTHIVPFFTEPELLRIPMSMVRMFESEGLPTTVILFCSLSGS